MNVDHFLAPLTDGWRGRYLERGWRWRLISHAMLEQYSTILVFAGCALSVDSNYTRVGILTAAFSPSRGNSGHSRGKCSHTAPSVHQRER